MSRMEVENRLGLMGKSKVAAKAEAVKEHWDEFSTLMAAGKEKQAGKEEFAYKDSGEGESEMVVCVRVRPRLMPFMLRTKSCANALAHDCNYDPNAHFVF